MSISPTQSANPLDQLARTLFQNFDTNKDGTLSADEFSALIAKLTGGLAPSATSTSVAAAVNATTPVLPTATAGRVARSLGAGFNAAKLANLEHRTPKYLFARVAQYTDLSTVTNKATAETALRGMVPELEASGLRVLDVKGDKIEIEYRGKGFWIDVVRGANSASPAFQWLPIKS